MVWCGVVWCGVVWCGVVWCGVVWCGVAWRGVAWCGVVWCGVVWCGVFLALRILINTRAEPRVQEKARAYLRAVTALTVRGETVPGPSPGTGGACNSPTKTVRRARTLILYAWQRRTTGAQSAQQSCERQDHRQMCPSLASAAERESVQCPSNPTNVGSLATSTSLYTKESSTKIS